MTESQVCALKHPQNLMNGATCVYMMNSKFDENFLLEFLYLEFYNSNYHGIIKDHHTKYKPGLRLLNFK